MSRDRLCKRCVWGGLLASSVLHALIAAAFFQTRADSSTDSGPGAEEPLDLDLAMFVEAAPQVGGAPQSLSRETAVTSTPVEPPETPPAPAQRAPAKPESSARPLEAETQSAVIPAPAKTEARPAPKPKPKPKASSEANPKPKSKPKSKPKELTQSVAKPKSKPQRPVTSPSSTTTSKPEQSRQTRGTRVGSAGREGSGSRSGASKAAKANAERAYLAALQRAISRHQRYPRSARRAGETGATVVAFSIQADGKLTRIRIAKSSGHSRLDQAAVEAMYRLGRFKPIPPSIGRDAWALRVPIRFDLK